MKDETVMKVVSLAVGIPSIVATYIAYLVCVPNPADGAVLAGIAATIALFVGWAFGKKLK